MSRFSVLRKNLLCVCLDKKMTRKKKICQWKEKKVLPCKINDMKFVIFTALKTSKEKNPPENVCLFLACSNNQDNKNVCNFCYR